LEVRAEDRLDIEEREAARPLQLKQPRDEFPIGVAVRVGGRPERIDAPAQLGARRQDLSLVSLNPIE